MALPRVFISSTCYDLEEIRDGLVSLINSLSYEPVFSERGDIFYHPDLHTHDSCINELNNCQLFVLVIGGRFGGHYIADRSKSIVNAEYQAAKECKIPVFSFVKTAVMEDHRLYEKNKLNKEIIEKIVFPSIEQPQYASDIFEFINEVRNSVCNNGTFTFTYGKDIQEILKKQWAGMLYDFLVKRKRSSELETATMLIGDLSITSKKTEELLIGVFKHLDNEKAEGLIKEIDKELQAKKFFIEIFRYFQIERFQHTSVDQLLKLDISLPWYKYLIQTGEFYVQEMGVQDEDRMVEVLCHQDNNRCIDIGGELTSSEKLKFSNFSYLFEAFKNLEQDQRARILSELALRKVN